jgi:cell pole-organizing protein PopZ
MSDTNAQEPTMEEILASIRRIISEDDAPAAPAAAAPEAQPEPAQEPAPPTAAEAPPPYEIDQGDDDDVLELTEPAPPLQEPAPEPVAAVPAESVGDLDVFTRPAPARPPEPQPAPAREAAYAPLSLDDEDGLTAAPTADHAASMFGQLSRTLAMPAEGRTLEDVVRELLRPMLKQWLDQNLPSIVETAVQSEVERISRRRI